MAGNPTVTHPVLGIDPKERLGMAPLILSGRPFPEVLAADLGLAGAVHPRRAAVVFPSFRRHQLRGLVAPGNREWLLTTAAPAAQAVEGAAIRCGGCQPPCSR